jgi:hypothetical protein
MRPYLKTILMLTTIIPTFAHAATAPKPGETIGYFLPKTEVVVTVTQRIVQCPSTTQMMQVVSQATIKPRVVADQYVEVDIRSGTFAERTTALVLRPNGTLESFNAKTEGQGGKILGAVTKVALTMASFAAGAPVPLSAGGEAPRMPACNDATRRLLSSRADAIQRADELEAVIAREGETTPRIAMLERIDEEIEFITDALTLRTKETITDLKTTGAQPLKRVDYAKWLDNFDPATINVVGKYGYKLDRNVGTVPDAIKEDGVTKYQRPVAALIYRRPVIIPVSIAPCLDDWDTVKSTCTEDESFDAVALTDTAKIPVPQLSKLFLLHVGRGGLFGSKEAKAKFDEFGTPVELSFGTSTGTDDAAAVIDSSLAGVVSVRDAKLSNLERRLAIAKAKKELAELGGSEEE